MDISLNFPESSYKGWSIENAIEENHSYQKLLLNGKVMMLNSRRIIEDFEEFIKMAEGDVLINGLGIGMCIVELLKKETLRSITVVEYDEDLVHLISPFFKHDTRCQIINEDAFFYEPPVGMKYDYVWHDIWTVQKASNHKEIQILKKKYQDLAAWQGAWREQEVKIQFEGLPSKF